ncbi:peptidylprolyl isomerase [Spirulina sp. CS-785/01]|uniref:peptidylprolyl isomerase n=1 Tax=Spirulina sp. CS-785/01 TaxID=3021716 RepID=UPI00232CF494|nr:peptidylprolyl isomerase [Spirulina sp. CS-785/01]MDB9315072.1 peptidylprolyl isomerase [Spirulina sp. CS-785/01]
MIRDWGLWELANSDWDNYLPMQSQQPVFPLSAVGFWLKPHLTHEVESSPAKMPPPAETETPPLEESGVESRESEIKKVMDGEKQVSTPQSSNSKPLLQIEDLTVTGEEIMPLLQKYQLLSKLVQEILIDRAIATIPDAPDELNTALENFFVSQNLTTDKQRQGWLQRQGMSNEDLQTLVSRRLKLEKFKEQQWGDTVETEFHNRKDQLDQVNYHLLRTKDAGIAQELYFRLLEGEGDFEELARSYSQGPEAKNGGAIGPVSLSNIHPTLQEMFHRSKPGQLWSPTFIDNWFVIARLDQFIPAEFDKKNRQQLLNDCFNQWLQEERQNVEIVAHE